MVVRMGIGLGVKANNQKYLKRYILDEGLCTGCGACVGLCPYQVIYHDRTVQLHKCDLENGKCYAFCPRTATDFAALRELLFEQNDLTPEIGAVKGYYFSQATDPELRKIAQHGATVTALIGGACEKMPAANLPCRQRLRRLINWSRKIKEI